MYNCSLVKFKDISSKYGNLTPIEGTYDIPYEIKRIFYIYGVPNEEVRGHHAHRKTYQTLICVHGSVKVKVKIPDEEEIFVLDSPDKGLMIGPMVWGEQFDYSEDAVLLVLTSDYFDENDYIRNYDIYLEEAKKIF
ncbi:TDP-4-oxo-6-deoxy-alpha-D-glucose-3,4-oxoisomerase [Clostridium tepidiprofundi DSM 19306]|uniref:TDP-4-oxo-6-deoxy-alpha-D-glucose-3, 4-oxoisomerase n=1 Tax=Clostridium tepidiprofundi DSM 19306 TaxID=1121338 RepID=A0A151ASN5_9CLOT|nr:FdtA/QdtA family cupin domain-containing protein [Clostridium tepidiprofundi]KYH30668.1 TDP-4-oxo-6-deoxy-alpha-D-glucose-3,4-oxoisomerase [Clostridium tepidiprofundi DSM 19306]